MASLLIMLPPLPPPPPSFPQVREAMASLLVTLSTCRHIHFYEVVPLEVLLEVLGHDCASVSIKVQQVLGPSYFPNPQEGSVSHRGGGGAR